MRTTLPGASYKEEGKTKRRRRMEVLAEPTVGLNKHVGLPPVFLHDESSESSSIGVESSSSEEDHGGGSGVEDEVQSKAREGPLGSLESLNESLPIKRGLSNFLTGKSKSFASLSAVGSVSAGDLVKPENPFNKRRRIIMACKSSWLRRASYCSLITSLPRHTLDEGEEEEVAAAAGGDDGSSFDSFPALPGRHNGNDERKVKRVLRSPRSFSLSDLQHA